jgi:hypothetical protein
MFTFVVMKRKYIIVSFVFAWSVLVAILIQSAHSFHHIHEEISKEKCFHNQTNNKAELTHSHENEHCFVCEFTLINGNLKQLDSYSLSKILKFEKKSNLSFETNHSFFKGSLFSYRGPPLF